MAVRGLDESWCAVSGQPIFRYLGVSLESPFAESPAPAAQFHLDLMSASLDTPNAPELLFEGSLGRGSETHRPGYYSPAGDVVVAVDINTIGWFLYAAQGGYEFTTAVLPALRTHELFASNASLLPSLCIRVGKDLYEHVFSGCIINQLELAITEGYATLTVDLAASVDGLAALSPLASLILPVSFPLMFHDVTATRDAGDVSAQIKTFSLVINNNSDAAFGQSIGSRYARKIVSNARTVTISADMFFNNDDELVRFWGGASGPVDAGTTEFAMGFLLDAGADGQLEIAAPRVIYDNVPAQPSGRTQMTQNVTMTAYMADHTLADAVTDVRSEILCTLTNVTGEMAPAP